MGCKEEGMKKRDRWESCGNGKISWPKERCSEPRPPLARPIQEKSPDWDWVTRVFRWFQFPKTPCFRGPCMLSCSKQHSRYYRNNHRKGSSHTMTHKIWESRGIKKHKHTWQEATPKETQAKSESPLLPQRNYQQSDGAKEKSSRKRCKNSKKR